MTQVLGPAFFILGGAVRKGSPYTRESGRRACRIEEGLGGCGEASGLVQNGRMDIFYLTIVRMSIDMGSPVYGQYSLDNFAVSEKKDKGSPSFLID